MIALNTGIQIDQAVGEIFQFVTTPQYYHLWNSAITSAEFLSGNGKLPGDKIKLVRHLHGKRTENILMVSAYISEEKYAVESIKGPTPFTMEYYFNPVGSAVSIDVHADIGTSSLVSIFGRVIGQVVQRGIDKNLASLKYLLENKPVSIDSDFE